MLLKDAAVVIIKFSTKCKLYFCKRENCLCNYCDLVFWWIHWYKWDTKQTRIFGILCRLHVKHNCWATTYKLKSLTATELYLCLSLCVNEEHNRFHSASHTECLLKKKKISIFLLWLFCLPSFFLISSLLMLLTVGRELYLSFGSQKHIRDLV